MDSPDDIEPNQRTQDRGFESVNFDVIIDTFDPARKIAHPPADEQGPPARLLNRFAKFDHGA